MLARFNCNAVITKAIIKLNSMFDIYNCIIRFLKHITKRSNTSILFLRKAMFDQKIFFYLLLLEKSAIVIKKKKKKINDTITRRQETKTIFMCCQL